MNAYVFWFLIAAIVAFLLITLVLVGYFVFKTVGQKKDGGEEKTVAAPVQEVLAVQQDDGQIAAAIAAVMMLLQADEKGEGGLYVKSVRRVGNNSPAWNLAGRRERI